MNINRNLIDLLWYIVHKLREEEIEPCVKYIKSLDRRLDKVDNLAEKLFNEVLKDVERKLSDEDYQIAIYGEIQYEPFKKLVSRLRNKVLESILMDMNLDRNGFYSTKSRKTYKIRKKLSYAHILQSRSLSNVDSVIYDSIIKEGIKYEIWPEVIEALSLKRWLNSVSQSPIEYQKTMGLLRTCRNTLRGIQRAEDLLSYVSVVTNNRKWTEDDTLELKEKINAVKELMVKYKSVLMEYYLIQSEIAYYQALKQYQNAEKCLIRLVQISSEEKAVSTPSRHAAALLNLAENSLYRGSYVFSLTKTNEALRIVTTTHITALRCFELQYYSSVYNGEYIKGITLINKAISYSEENGWNFIKDKWQYLKACGYFAIGDFETADKILSEFRQIEFDKEGFSIYLKFLLVMISFERDKRSILFSRIEGIRKQIQLLKRKGRKLNRENAIYEVLRELSNQGFDFKKTNQNKSETLLKLRKSTLYKWSIMSPEIILFEEWFKCKLEGVAFKQNISLINQTDDNLKIAK